MPALLERFKRSDIDIHLLRLCVILIFLIFGNTKWFEFEVELLKPLISPTWLSFLYDLLGHHGTSYLLGVVESTAYVSLIIGFARPRIGIIGSLLVILTALTTLSMLPQLGGFNAFIVKDLLLLGAGAVLLKHDLRRLDVAAKHTASITQPQRAETPTALSRSFGS
ncbi:MAG: DUF417 family protein [Lautropia sp.]|nr:DUF417 family protein [Lautropia sp.]